MNKRSMPSKLANALTEHAFKQYDYRKVISKGEHEIDGKKYEVKKIYMI